MIRWGSALPGTLQKRSGHRVRVSITWAWHGYNDFYKRSPMRPQHGGTALPPSTNFFPPQHQIARQAMAMEYASSPRKSHRDHRNRRLFRAGDQLQHPPRRRSSDARGVERASDERRLGRNIVVDLPLEIIGDLGDRGKIHAVHRAAEGRIFHRHRLKRAIPRALADAEEGTVDGGSAVQPCCGRIGDRFIKVVMAVPLEQFVRNARVVMETVHDALNASGQRRPGEGNAEPHRITHSDLDGDTALMRKAHEFRGKGNDKPVKTCTGDILEVTARTDTERKRAFDDTQILIERLPAGEVHLFEDMIVRTSLPAGTPASVTHLQNISSA